ncbi:transposase, IS110 family, partial [Wolbachia endosymbiont of Drosophila ananassae]
MSKTGTFSLDTTSPERKIKHLYRAQMRLKDELTLAISFRKER